MPGDQIRLLALDGGGVRGLSSLMILDGLMATVDPESPPKPSEYFDMIGGTSTGGLIAVMLGRLRMTVHECIEAYTSLSDKVFEKKSHRVKINGKLQGRFDAAKLEDTIKEILRARDLNEDVLLKDVAASCKVFVCATSKQTSDTVCLASYGSPRSKNLQLLNSATIWQACRATSAATGFFDPIAIGPFDEEFVDGALGANNPIYMDTVFKQMQACANNLAGRQYYGPYRTVFSLEGMPVSDHFVDRLSDTAELEQCLLPRRLRFRHEQQRKIFVLHGLGGIGKTQLAADFARRHRATFSSVFWLDGRSEDRLRQSLASCANRIPHGQIPDRSWKSVPSSEDDLNVAVTDVLGWLARPDNVDWLLIFDNVDQDHEQGGTTSAFDVRRYLPSDHGSVLITTRLSQLEQLGNTKHTKQLKKVDEDLSKAIFEQWYGGELVLDTAGRELLGLLDGLPLALAQAAAYCRETGLDVTSDQDRLSEAEAMYQRALQGYEKGLGPDNPSTLSTVNNLGLLYSAQGRLPEAEAMLQRALQGFEKAFGPDHRLTLTTVNNLGLLYEERGRLPEVEVMLQWALQGFEKTLGPDHLSSLDTVHNLGFLYSTQGRLLEAETMYQRALQGFEKALGPDNRSTLTTVNNLGLLYSAQGRLPEAEAMLQRALQGFEKTLRPDHPWTLETVHNLDLLYHDYGPHGVKKGT
ncbi:hypothetical protein HMPREF1624_01159 [Sporothrix schenckii ATCC 58251]|uniref:PNPLA domain-containing protein n=1 Tax=Sporothrix schenckii (strain ATCC 58251 / de Perez 2211183) TaxID=1391915 RepID=U7Q7X3_SPOS1|nr:hypothetical protein HMPREF1624_01159 [Sporothrix schenckii ATCC 58251]